MEYAYVTLIAAAALWGAAAGALVPRPAYRMSVEPEEAWRCSCPAGHPITGPARGWLGTARCANCAVSPVPAPPEPVPAGAPGAGAREVPAGGEVPGAQETVDAHGGADETGGDAVREPAAYRPSFVVPAVTGLACAALASAVGPRPELAVWLLLAPLAVLLALVDRNVHRLPDQLTLPLAAAAAVLLGAAALVPGAGGSWPTALLGGPVLGGAYLVLFLVNPNGMGFGDVKLALSLGVVLGWYGWEVLFVGAFAGFLLGAVYGLGLVVLRGAGRGTAIPFGPFMISGTLIGLLLGALAL
ncbi:prepilin peptidase [Streptomyces wuyuanensis]|uniref:Leader peptidase (Prepilin peptidase) / N-methyltransferase n=1 Tax=Streptomyces wuyuanensis TaxID=1196353 RepID=A0A1G9P1D2_9ACTN|nr:A24 family peptidase [Streptomyces wuyuanensis]SDL92047.1 leader peptidase (prepilin peptidase) / N-methyltransferase [Streptomyces wuyuanensis]